MGNSSGGDVLLTLLSLMTSHAHVKQDLNKNHYHLLSFSTVITVHSTMISSLKRIN